ncbi:MAG: sarcosine oxidase subunit delta [Mesorhizobium sp.]|uniref:sarcosine oxidase subunit delta n=1 Tax=Mesorhizobium sp. TaxID=1871066 RepID=UPI000FE7F67D|nr:sarcosine oxidase subunit delta [Mesorhizobium sp.]RWP86654.1 MAG: sarcosine oxidase subunit delta [Mesorhizobium sp.]TIM24047.1 MAG: sarcosine oxidase subunit delta [Mesorhizobium sp.]
MLISCPLCGPRDSGEFTFLGDATPSRPAFAADQLDGRAAQEAFYDYVYLRDNLAGDMQEYWYHGGGCRSWLVAVRNTVTHEFKSVRVASGAGAGQPEQAGDA